MKNLFIYGFLLTFLWACSDDEMENPTPASIEIREGSVIVVNEGSFGQGNGSLSFLHKDEPEVEKDVIAQANDGSLTGDVVQSALSYLGKLYIVVNADSKILISNENTFQLTGIIEEELSNPRYLLIVDEKIFVTNWNSDFENSFVAVFDANTLNHIRNIETDAGTERIHFDGNHIWVTNNFTNTIQIFGPEDAVVQKTITTAFAPNNIKQLNDELIVLCQGEFGKTGTIVKYDLNTFDSIESYQLSFRPLGSFHIQDNERIYLSNGSTIYVSQLDNASSITSFELIFSVKAFESIYAFEVSPDGYLWITDSKGFIKNGRVYRYGTNGVFQRSWEVGIGPNSFLFY